MNYPDGQHVKVGDAISLGGDRPGVVVCSIDDGTYTDACRERDWAYLGRGVMIEFRDFGLIHYVDPDPDLELVAREAPFP